MEMCVYLLPERDQWRTRVIPQNNPFFIQIKTASQDTISNFNCCAIMETSLVLLVDEAGYYHLNV